MRRGSERRDVEKERYWQGIIREGARSGMSIREFCRHRRIKESQLYAWRRELKYRDEESGGRTRAKSTRPVSAGATFALVTEGSEGVESAGIELVLTGGKRLRIGRGVDAETLGRVVAVLVTVLVIARLLRE